MTVSIALILVYRYFKSNRFETFSRQVSHYLFSRVGEGNASSSSSPSRRAYFHEYFLRGRPDLISRIFRPSRNGHCVEKKVLAPADFSRYPLCRELSKEEIASLTVDESCRPLRLFGREGAVRCFGQLDTASGTFAVDSTVFDES